MRQKIKPYELISPAQRRIGDAMQEDSKQLNGPPDDKDEATGSGKIPETPTIPDPPDDSNR